MLEEKIRESVIRKLRMLEWFVKIMHMNMFTSGFPDLFCAHYKYGIRLVEIKQPRVEDSSFTPAQLENFPKMEAAGVGIWILVSDSDQEYAKLFKAPNWRQYQMMKMLSGR